MKNLKLEKQMQKFIKSGLKETCFTNDLYEMLYIHTNLFIAHFNKSSFYERRFLREADKTAAVLLSVSKPELKKLCLDLSAAINRNMRTVVIEKTIKTVGVQ